MKRARGLFSQIVTLENLRLAAWKALRGKRRQDDARRFVSNLDAELSALQTALLSGAMPNEPPRQFLVYDPKLRTISAPSFQQRVLHHAIMNVVEPVLERFAIHHSYACRQGKGQFAALAAAQQFSRRHGWFLKLDVRGYFASIHKEVLLELLARKFKEPKLLHVFHEIVCGFQPEQECGLPIGSLVSQHLANFYLGHLDHRILEQRTCSGYVRYMVDFILWGDSHAELHEMAAWIQQQAGERLRLNLKPAIIQRTMAGITFLGHRVCPQRLDLSHRSKVRYARKLTDLHSELKAGSMTEASAQARATCLVAFTQRADCAAFRQSVNTRLAQEQKAPTA